MNSFKTFLKKCPVLLPPLSGYTDVAFRTLLAEFGVPVFCTEMVNARAVVEGNKKTYAMLKRVECFDAVQGVQLVGHDANIMGRAADIVQDAGFDYLDINMGCTVRKVVRKGEGVALMKDPLLAANIVRRVVRNLDIPVSVKMRSGFDDKTLNAVELASVCVEAGAALVCVHGRSGQHRFQGLCDHSIIASVAESLDVPVVGNGGLLCGDDGIKMMNSTGCDAVMPGRWLIGNPWCFEQILSAISGKSYSSPSLDERKKWCKRHIELAVEFLGEKDTVIVMRRIFHKYFPECINGIYLKNKLHESVSLRELYFLLESIDSVGQKLFFVKN